MKKDLKQLVAGLIDKHGAGRVLHAFAALCREHDAPENDISWDLLGRRLETEADYAQRLEGCNHTSGYWINQDSGQFRCYDCGCQHNFYDLKPREDRQIEIWVG